MKLIRQLYNIKQFQNVLESRFQNSKNGAYDYVNDMLSKFNQKFGFSQLETLHQKVVDVSTQSNE